MSTDDDTFKVRSAEACIRALRRLERTAIMLERYAEDVFPPPNELGQKAFGMVLMESAAASIRDAWKDAITEVVGGPLPEVANPDDGPGFPDPRGASAGAP